MSVVNAIASGLGASLAVDLASEATVTLLEETRDITVRIAPDVGEDPTLAREVVRAVLARAGIETPYGALVETTSTIPMSRGLKSSSAAANAIALATNAALSKLEGRQVAERDLLDAGVAASLAARVSITGAYDDACASFYGGLCVTDNTERRLLVRHELPADLVAVVHVPARKTRKASVKDLSHAGIASVVKRAHALALAGNWAEAMTLNGLAYGALYGTPAEPVLRALAAGARGASVSGTGPALAAIAPREHAKAVAEAFASTPGEVLTLELVRTKAVGEPC
ncbi:MAG: shikimate kinase [Thermoplasmatota archaeon]